MIDLQSFRSISTGVCIVDLVQCRLLWCQVYCPPVFHQLLTPGCGFIVKLQLWMYLKKRMTWL